MTRKRDSGSVIPRGIRFAQVPYDCNEDPVVTNAGYRVYGFLVRLSNSESRAWPGHRYIADRLPLSRPTVAAAIANLEAAGWIEVDRSAQHHTYIVNYELNRLDLDWNRPTNLTGQEPLPVKKPVRTGKETSPEPVKKLGLRDTHDRYPNTDTHLATRNVAWEWLTGSGFKMTATTAATRKRVGMLARELNAKLESSISPDLRPTCDEMFAELDRRARQWPAHFPDATMTADAYVKHFEMLGGAPLRVSMNDAAKAATRAAVRDLIEEER